MQVNSVQGFGFGYSGPNQTQVEADNAKAVAGGLNGGFSLADILTDNDKALTGYSPASGKINQLAIAVANYRYNGGITGEVTPQFVKAIQDSIAKTGGYPSNPAALMQKAGLAAPSMTSDTFNSLLSILNPPNDGAG
ncbi:MAG TPA: hypothetical protein VGM25_02110 [Caulobacteraceae bacterium]|jgi:hypothetical protein